MTLETNNFRTILNNTVIVAALGYFVDVYDLVLFLIIGVKSLEDLYPSYTPELITQKFQFLLDVQMIGMLIGGIVWGIIGDKKGRLSVLFGSIIMYSLANILNGFVLNMEMYTVLRFIAGFGLAGELGAGITLVAEQMDKEKRGYGTMIIASFGVIGAILASIISTVGWQMSYFIGGALGISLLLLRIGVVESGMFQNLHNQNHPKGNFFDLFKNTEVASRYFYCILIGLPVWFIIGVLIARAPKFAELLHIEGTVQRNICIALCYAGLSFGDVASGTISQFLRSRKKTLSIFFGLCLLFVSTYLNLNYASLTLFYGAIFFMGFGVGFWAIFVTVASENFGTNLRATTSTTIPNFVRGSLVPIAFIFDLLKAQIGMILSAYILIALIMFISFWALSRIKETFGKDMNYVELS